MADEIAVALERAPVVAIPEGFAKRVAGQVAARDPQMHALAISGKSYGKAALWASVPVLLLLMVWAALRTRGDAGSAVLDGILFVEFCALILWLFSPRRHVPQRFVCERD